MKVSAEDLKQIAQLGMVLQKATFKELSGPECLTVTMTIQWLSELKKRMELDLQPPVVLQPVMSSAAPSKVVKLDTSKPRKK